MAKSKIQIPTKGLKRVQLLGCGLAVLGLLLIVGSSLLDLAWGQGTSWDSFRKELGFVLLIVSVGILIWNGVNNFRSD